MSAKLVTCCVCNRQVSKRSTLAVSDGRACRSHQQAQEVAATNSERRKLQIDRVLNSSRILRKKREGAQLARFEKLFRDTLIVLRLHQILLGPLDEELFLLLPRHCRFVPINIYPSIVISLKEGVENLGESIREENIPTLMKDNGFVSRIEMEKFVRLFLEELRSNRVD